MLSVFFGLIAVGFALKGLSLWSEELLQLLKGLGPISLLFAGVVAIIAGLASRSSKKTPPTSKKGS